jgi:hypothetical protein
MPALHTAIASRFGSEMPVVNVVKERIDTRISDNIHTTATPAVTTIGSTKRDVLLTAEVHGTVATSASPNKNLYLITKPWHLITLLAAH